MKVFGLLNRSTGPWFKARLGQAHTIHLDHWPHVAALLGDYDTYLAYLAASWKYYAPHLGAAAREAALDRFLELTEDCKTNGIRVPVKIVTRVDGLHLVAAGNHRTAISYVHGLDLPTEEVPPHRWVALALADDPVTASYRVSAYLGADVDVDRYDA